MSDPAIARRIKDVDLQKGLLKNKDEILAAVADPEEAERLYQTAQLFERQLKENGFGVYRPMRKEWRSSPLGELKNGDTFRYNRDQYKVVEKVRAGGVNVRKLEDGKMVGKAIEFPREWEMDAFLGEPMYVLPKPFIDDLDFADKIFGKAK